MSVQVAGFEDVVTGRQNNLVVAIAKQVAKGPVCKRSNPFVIEGESGFGKTTILNAIARAVEAMKDGRNMIHSTCDRIFLDYLEALRRNKVDVFRTRYETVDVLLLDQFEAAKGAASFIEELLHIFDSRMRMKKQTVVATAVRLEALQHKECPAEFIGRLMSGVAVRLGRPDKRMRIAALRRELRESGENFPDAVSEVMANASKKNMGSLGGMLHRVMFAREVMGKSALRQKNLDEMLDK